MDRFSNIIDWSQTPPKQQQCSWPQHHMYDERIKCPGSCQRMDPFTVELTKARIKTRSLAYAFGEFAKAVFELVCSFFND